MNDVHLVRSKSVGTICYGSRTEHFQTLERDVPQKTDVNQTSIKALASVLIVETRDPPGDRISCRWYATDPAQEPVADGTGGR